MQTIKDNIIKILEDKTKAKVITISGEWGVGKTYFWKEEIENNIKSKEVIYISLFGKEHYKDILEEIVLKLYKNYNDVAKKCAKFISKIATLVSNGNININPEAIFSLLKKNDFENIVICFDDIERMSKKLDIVDFLGLISQLKENKACSVVLILNTNQLESSNMPYFNKYAEKAIDLNFSYQPNVEDNFKIAVKIVKLDKCFDNDKVLEYLNKAQLNNIRIIIYVLESLNDFAQVLQKIDNARFDFNNNIIEVIIKELIFLKIVNDRSSFNKDEFNDYITLSIKGEYNKVNYNLYHSEFSSIPIEIRSEEEERKYLELNAKYNMYYKYSYVFTPHNVEYTDIDILVRCIDMYYKNCIVDDSARLILNNISRDYCLHKAVESVLSLKKLFFIFDKNIDEIFLEFETRFAYFNKYYYSDWFSIMRREKLEQIIDLIKNMKDTGYKYNDSVKEFVYNIENNIKQPQNVKINAINSEINDNVKYTAKQIILVECEEFKHDNDKYLELLNNITKDEIIECIQQSSECLKKLCNPYYYKDKKEAEFRKQLNLAFDELKQDIDFSKKMEWIEKNYYK